MKRVIAGALSLGALVMAALPAVAQDNKTLTVWFSKGFYRSEDESLWATIKKFEQKTGIKVELSQYAIQDMIPKTVAALDSGSPPDVGYSDTYNNQAAGKWAFEGKLEDLTDVLQPMMMPRFAPQTVEHVLLMNGQTGKKAYYGFPLKRQTLHTEIWGDMLEKAGFKQADIPQKWSDYWAFWCDKVQPGYRKASGTRTYGIGAPMGVESTDSFQSFYAFMDAYDAKLVDADGKLTVDDPKTREGVVKALKDYTDPYVKGCVPRRPRPGRTPTTTSLPQPHHGDDAQLHHLDRREVVRGQRQPEQHARAARGLEEGLRGDDHHRAVPERPDGKPMTYRADVKQGVVFSGAKNKAAAKEFVKFIMEEDNLRPYVEGAIGRWFRSPPPRSRARSGRPTSTARRSTTSSSRAPSRSTT